MARFEKKKHMRKSIIFLVKARMSLLIRSRSKGDHRVMQPFRGISWSGWPVMAKCALQETCISHADKIIPGRANRSACSTHVSVSLNMQH